MLIIQFTQVTCVGRKEEAGQKRTSGIFYPQDGEKNAMFAGRFVDADGEFRRVEFYNGPNSKPGKGLADVAAKWITKGKTVSFQARAKNIQIDYRDPNQNYDPIIHNGNVLKVDSVVYRVMPGTLILGNSHESQNQINNEILNFDPANPSTDVFFRRPANWNTENSPDKVIMTQIMDARKVSAYVDGMDYYGHALVWNSKKKSENAQTDTQKVAAAADAITQIGGISLQDLRTNGWTDAQILSDATYGVLLAKMIPAAPAGKVIPSAPSTQVASDLPIYEA